MSYKKTLGIISVFILTMFALMLSSSYAWYSFNNASTAFNASTDNESIDVIYKNNNYISTITAVPISSDEVEEKSEKNNFSININNQNLEEEIVVSISLTSIVIDNALKNNNFRYELLYNNKIVSNGNFSNVVGDNFNILKGITLNNFDDNDFELRVYLLDDGSSQNSLMSKTFKAVISVNVISRIKTSLENQDIDILFKDIVIDGKVSEYLPSSGRYTMNYVCDNGSNISWDPLTRTIVYGKGSVINDRCSLTFTKDDNYPVIGNIVYPGDYVRYSGNNGCVGKSCQGENVNYVSDDDMGYCGSSSNKFVTNGWRVLYIDTGSIYIVSAGSVECVDEFSIDSLNSRSLKYCNTDYVYGGVCNNSSVRVINSDDYSRITKKSLDNCYDKKSNKACGYNNNLIDNGGNYLFASNYNSDVFVWNAKTRSIFSDKGSNKYGLRPVIRIASDKYVLYGKGTYDDPYVLSASK